MTKLLPIQRGIQSMIELDAFNADTGRRDDCARHSAPSSGKRRDDLRAPDAKGWSRRVREDRLLQSLWTLVARTLLSPCSCLFSLDSVPMAQI